MPRSPGRRRGTYAGDYTNKAGKSGGYQLTLTPGPDGHHPEKSSPCWTVGRPGLRHKLVVKGDSIEAAYDFEVKGNKASSRITGQKTGETFSGKFETLYKGKVVDTGTWKTIRKKS